MRSKLEIHRDASMHPGWQRPSASLLLIMALLGLVLAASPVGASTCSLADHIRSANSNTSVGGCPRGTSHDIITITEDITLSEALPPITGSVTIEGGGHSISGKDAYRIFDVNGGTLDLTNVTLTQGNGGKEVGGAIRLRNSAQVSIAGSTLGDSLATGGGAIAMAGSGNTLTVSSSSFVSNRAEEDGGAILADGGTLQISESTFERNCAEIAAHRVDIDLTEPRHERSSDEGCPTVTFVWPRPEDIAFSIEGRGGAIHLLHGARARIVASTFSRNKGTEGGAVATADGDVHLVISGSSISGSRSKGSGGAVDITESSFRDNSAEKRGGVLFGESGSVSISNSTFHNNRASSSGGALLVAGADVTLTHVTMIDNWAMHSSGGAIHKEEGIVWLRNSLIAATARTDDCSGGIDEMAGNLSADGTCAILPYSEDLLLGGLTGWPAHYPLLDYSPAVDAADHKFCLDNDQAGTARPAGDGCDIGAIESIPVATSISGCVVTATHTLNFREGPGGTRFGTVREQSTLSATARTVGWFQVEYRGVIGWISADYVVAEGDCG